MTLSIICPLYKAEKYIDNLDMSLKRQLKVEIKEIKYIVTECYEDKTIEKLKNINAKYRVIKAEEFSHSLTREKAVYEAEGDIIVFITQDIIIKSDMWLYNLTNSIEKGVCEASFSKQICEEKTIERYTRMNNYPSESRILSKKDIDKLGIMTYFYSDASSAIRKDIFIKLNGYDKKNLLTNEDMYIAYKLINNGYRIKYCSDSEIIHSHKYTYLSLLKRYFDQGVFLKQHEYINNSGANSSAINLAKFVLVNSLKEKSLKVFFEIIPNFGARYIGNKLGQRYEKLSKKTILKYTNNPNYWNNEFFN